MRTDIVFGMGGTIRKEMKVLREAAEEVINLSFGLSRLSLEEGDYEDFADIIRDLKEEMDMLMSDINSNLIDLRRRC